MTVFHTGSLATSLQANYVRPERPTAVNTPRPNSNMTLQMSGQTQNGRFDVLTLDAQCTEDFSTRVWTNRVGMTDEEMAAREREIEAHNRFNDSYIAMIEQAKIDAKGLSYSGTIKFFNKRIGDWVKDVQQNDIGVFKWYLKFTRKTIEQGKPELAKLPPDFTMHDYERYMSIET